MDRNLSACHPGLEALRKAGLLRTIWQRRTHRVSVGGPGITAGSMSYVSDKAPHPLDELEEAVLIAITGSTGLTMPDRPFSDPSGNRIMAKPNLTMSGRSAGSPDNAQGTHFFIINDTGTFFLKKLPPWPSAQAISAEVLIERAQQSKVKLSDHRLDIPQSQTRNFPAYLDSNRFLSNLPGTTILFPIVDISQQYINGLLYLLTEPDGSRPTIVDDRNYYRCAGVNAWVKKGFLNEDIKIPLGSLGTLRTHIEADLLLQNLMLIAEGMGLGAWIHASVSPPILLGDPKFKDQYGEMLGFEFVVPPFRFLDFFRWQIPSPKYRNLRANPVGLKRGDEFLIKAMCPPYYKSMAAAVDAVIQLKFGVNGTYSDEQTFERIYKGNFGRQYLTSAAEYSPEVIACTRDICEYIYATHGRFPAHVDALYVPGVWIQVHHPELEYYERFFNDGLTQAHREHNGLWHQRP